MEGGGAGRALGRVLAQYDVAPGGQVDLDAYLASAKWAVPDPQ